MPDGTEGWTRQLTAGEGNAVTPADIAVDAAGYVYVASIFGDSTVYQYLPDGNEGWTRELAIDGWATIGIHSIEVDGWGNI